MRALTRCLLAFVFVCISGVATADPAQGQGIRLSGYLESLNEQGNHIIYSSDLVTDELRVPEDTPPISTRADLVALLQPFGLTVQDGPSDSLLVVRLEPNATTTATPVETPQQEPLAEIVVTSSLRRLEYSGPGNYSYLDRDLATRVPAAAEEAVRLPNRLPGLANGGISARSYIRGGESNETLFLLDGLRLYEPFHLKDFQAVATTVNSNAISGMDFYAGAFPARYGDRMSGVIEMYLRQPEKDMQTELALSFFNASLLSLGNFGSAGQGDWLVAARRGNLDLIVDLVDPDIGSPDYRDFVGHVGYEFGPRTDLSFNFLLSVDELQINDLDRGEQATARYDNQVVWLNWRAQWTDMLRSETVFSFTDIDNSRNGTVDMPGIVIGALDDQRDFRALAFKQDWTFVPSSKWLLGFGVDAKHLDGRYDFESSKLIAPPFDGILQNTPIEAYDIYLLSDGAQYATYAELRWRITDRFTVDIGYRWDYQSYTTAADDAQSSPRISVLYEPGDRTSLRLGWGQYSQAQEVSELQVSDGNDEYFPAQRAEHIVANLKHTFVSGIDLDVSLFRKSFRATRPRYENAFDQLSVVPEIQFDRMMVDADTAESRGAEILLSHGSGMDSVFWWVGYTWSKVEDSFPDGERVRSWDQTHAAKLGASWRWGHWNFSTAGEIHTGWPKTELIPEVRTNPDGSQDLVLSTTALNSRRHSEFSSLDVRVSRDFDLGRGELMVFLDVTNLFNRENPCCTEYSLAYDDDGNASLQSRTSHWLPLVPSLGFVWTF
jgi:outer membrane receptor protein involved in Fe transport